MHNYNYMPTVRVGIAAPASASSACLPLRGLVLAGDQRLEVVKGLEGQGKEGLEGQISSKEVHSQHSYLHQKIVRKHTENLVAS